MSTPFRLRLLDALVERDATGTLHPPGGTCSVRLVEADETELVANGRGDGLDVYFAGPRGHVVSFALSPYAALRLAWFIVVRWWGFRLWCGVKLSLWRWVLRRA